MQMTVGERIVAARKRADINQGRLAELVSVSISTLAKIERGEQSPRVELVLRIAEAVGVDSSELLV